jgi:hypothetical protein
MPDLDGSRPHWTAIVNRVKQQYPDLAYSIERFTLSTRGRLARALVHALRGLRPDPRSPLSEAVGDASHELQAAGLDDRAVLKYFGALVENTGRDCGADRPSLMSGELRWVAVRSRVLAFASIALARKTAGTASQ